MDTRICGCGCGHPISPRNSRPGRGKYVVGHNRRGKGKKPVGDPPLCACGCSKAVTWDKDFLRWNTFSLGHNLTNPPKKERYHLAPLCICGCGIPTSWSTSRKRWNRFITGHNSRSPEARAANSARKSTPENIAQFRESARAAQADLEQRERNRLAIKAAMQRPDVREANRLRGLARWANPDNRARWLAVNSSNHARQLRSEAMKRRIESGTWSPRAKDGLFVSAKMACTMHYASSYERRFLDWCEHSPDVLTLATYKLHKIRIPYPDPEGGLVLWYYPDILVEMADGSTFLCEVKPAGLTSLPLVAAKAHAALGFCKEQGHIYCFVTEHTLASLESGRLDRPTAEE